MERAADGLCKALCKPLKGLGLLLCTTWKPEETFDLSSIFKG